MAATRTILDDDDRPIGRVLTRREVLALFGAAAGAGVLAACSPASLLGGSGSPSASAAASAASEASAAATQAAVASGSAALPSCIVRPELTEGPYFVDEMLQRSDITADPGTGAVSAGVPLSLDFMVSNVAGAVCTPLVGALVDVWHCDAAGVYSDVAGSQGTKFLRGYQLTDANGVAKFATIYPGWYPGRAVHIHFKIRTAPQADSAHQFTSQLFFDDALSDTVFAKEPYSAKGNRGTRNENDGIFRDSGGQLTLAPAASGNGYAATFDIGVQIA